MDTNPQINKPEQPASSAELLSTEARSLVELVEIQKSQKAQIEKLQRQNERIIGLLTDAKEKNLLAHVKIEDVNMPFGALIGFLVKVSLASIPAMLILGVIYLLVVALFGGLLAGLGGLF